MTRAKYNCPSPKKIKVNTCCSSPFQSLVIFSPNTRDLQAKTKPDAQDNQNAALYSNWLLDVICVLWGHWCATSVGALRRWRDLGSSSTYNSNAISHVISQRVSYAIRTRILPYDILVFLVFAGWIVTCALIDNMLRIACPPMCDILPKGKPHLSTEFKGWK